MNRRANLILPILLGLFFTIQTSTAQVVNVDTLVYPLSTTGQSFENYLVSLAWNNNPEFKVYASELKIAQTEVQIAKRAWADDWNITLNLNENNLNTSTEGGDPIELTDETSQTLTTLDLDEVRTLLESSGQTLNVNNFPRYNFGLTLNLGSLLTRGKEVEIAEERVMIEQLNENHGKFEIRAEVYRAFLIYTQSIKSLKIIAKQEQTAADIFDLMKTRFKSGSIDFDDFNQSQDAYNRALAGLNVAEEKVVLAELEIQELIGMPLKLARFYYDENNGG